MQDNERRDRGIKYFSEVYGGIVPLPPKELQDEFFFNAVDQLFAEIWSRPAMSIRDRRLFIMGVIAAQAEPETFEIQVRSVLHKGELTASDVRELVLILPFYAGYPRASKMRGVAERIIAELEQAQKSGAK